MGVGVGVSLDAELVDEARLFSEGKFRSWSTTCEPRKPQPPTTRTVPRDIVREVISMDVVVAMSWSVRSSWEELFQDVRFLHEEIQAFGGRKVAACGGSRKWTVGKARALLDGSTTNHRQRCGG